MDGWMSNLAARWIIIGCPLVIVAAVAVVIIAFVVVVAVRRCQDTNGRSMLKGGGE